MGILSTNTNEHLYQVVKNNVLKDFNEGKSARLNNITTPIMDRAPKKILFIRDIGLGDILMTLPTVRQIKKLYPNSIITYASRAKYHKLLELYNFINGVEDVLCIDEKLREYDKVYDVRNKLENYRDKKNQRHRVDSIAEVCDIKLISKKIEIPPLATKYKKRVKKLFNNNDVPTDKRLIGLVTKGTFRLRSWPMEYAMQLCLSSRENQNIHYLLLAESSEYGFKLSNTTDLTGKLDLLKLISVVKECDAVISADTGTLHIAGALDIPTIGIFGSIPPVTRIMYYRKCYVLNAHDKVECSPCFDKQFGNRKSFYHCMHMDVMCMRAIKPMEVYERLKYILFKKDKVVCDFCGAYDMYFYYSHGKILTVCNHCGRQIVRSENGN